MTTEAKRDELQLLTIREAARRLKVGEKAVRAWIKKGELPVIELGDAERSKQRISNKGLEKFLESRTVVHQPPAPRQRPRPAGRQWF